MDAERGVLLRLASLIDDRPFRAVEILEIAFDEDFPPDTFVFTPPPGEQARPMERPSMRLLTLHEAAREAPFTVLAPSRVPAGMILRVRLTEIGGSHPRVVVWMHFHSPDAGHGFQMSQSPTLYSGGPPPMVRRSRATARRSRRVSGTASGRSGWSATGSR